MGGDMKVLVLELAGIACLIGAAAVLSPALGLAVLGVACLVSAWSLAKSTKQDEQ
jgi:hypothetical protein